MRVKKWPKISRDGLDIGLSYCIEVSERLDAFTISNKHFYIYINTQMFRVNSTAAVSYQLPMQCVPVAML